MNRETEPTNQRDRPTYESLLFTRCEWVPTVFDFLCHSKNDAKRDDASVNVCQIVVSISQRAAHMCQSVANVCQRCVIVCQSVVK